ncbi:cadherin-like and PC-esterase domain-containing protein 1 isoform X2 [Oscarella lobularis]|uniref:cadherin-like and PC-esterase domain-containing protein 1 isoform X2 n=1 Tax=Oscarella lobularis TaxID=121494 RepID=UPI0033134F29
MKLYCFRVALRTLLAVAVVFAVVTTLLLNRLFVKDASPSVLVQDSIRQSADERYRDQQTQTNAILAKLEEDDLSGIVMTPHVVSVRGTSVVVDRDSPAYVTALKRLGFRDDEEKNDFNWLLLLCLANNDGSDECLRRDDYTRLKYYQKVSRIPGLRETLWKKDRLCSIMHLAYQYANGFVDSSCWILPSQLSQFLSAIEFMESDSQWIIKSTSQGRGAGIRLLTKTEIFQEKISFLSRRAIGQRYFGDQLQVQGLPISVRAYVLVTSVLPLRVYLYREGIVMFRGGPKYHFKKMAGRLWYFDQLRNHLKTKYGASAALKAFDSIGNAVVKMLLATQPLLAKEFEKMSGEQRPTYRCLHCFQLLAVDLMLNSDFDALVVEVDGQPNLSETDKDSSEASSSVKRVLVQDALRALFVRKRVAGEIAAALNNLEGIKITGINCESSADFCLSSSDIIDLLYSRRESKQLGNFDKLYPSAKGKTYSSFISKINLKNEKKPSNLWHYMGNEMHDILTKLEIQYETALQRERFPLRNSIRPNKVFSELKTRKFRDCVQDPSTKPYLSMLSVSPGTLVPPFHPENKAYEVRVSNEVVLAHIKAKAAHCDSEARLESKNGPPTPSNWSLNVGSNVLRYYIVDLSHTHIWVLSQYIVQIVREDLTASEAEFDPSSSHQVCSLVQECDFVLLSWERCGLQPTAASSWTSFWEKTHASSVTECTSGDAEGRWVLPCGSCQNRRSCYWKLAAWVPYHCRHAVLPPVVLQGCLSNKKVLFLGDSTLRGMMYYMIEKINGTLSYWDKSHTAVAFKDIMGPKSVTFTYFPPFWLPEDKQPVLEKVLYDLLHSNIPLANSRQTVLVIGGLQWVTEHHLSVISNLLERMGLSKIAVVIKGFSTGFNQPIAGIRYRTLAEQKGVFWKDRLLAKSSKQFGFYFVNTFNMTFSRYKHFIYGACGCHFHSVIALESKEAHDSTKSTYHVTGSINAAYTEIMNNLLCLAK